jgi:hypothetical protein
MKFKAIIMATLVALAAAAPAIPNGKSQELTEPDVSSYSLGRPARIIATDG